MSSLIVPATATRLTAAASDQEMLGVARDWAHTLAAQDYERAYGMTAHDPYYAWSASLIRRVIEGYGLPESHPSGTRFPADGNRLDADPVVREHRSRRAAGGKKALLKESDMHSIGDGFGRAPAAVPT